MENRIAEIIKNFRFHIASAIYPDIPEYTEKINAYDIKIAEWLLVDAIGRDIPMAIVQAAMRLSSDNDLRERIICMEADDYYESDGHYETGLTRDGNRERTRNSFPSPADFRKFYREMREKM